MQQTMKVLFALLLLSGSSAALSSTESPISKVVQLLTDLEAKVKNEGQSAQKTYAEFSEWCEDRSKNLDYEIKTGKAEVEDLKAAAEHAATSAEALSAQIDETAASLSSNEADLKAAKAIRDKESADFSAEEKELVEVIGALERAVAVLERESRRGGPAMVQLQKTSSLTEALRIMVEASMLRSQDATRLAALVQSSDSSDDDSTGAPDPAVYESHSGSIIETLEGLTEKAKDMLNEARKKEANSQHNFELLTQSLTDEIKFANQDFDDAKKQMAAQTEARATAEGDLAVTSKTLDEDTKSLASLKHNCMMKAEDFEAAKASRAEELKALAEAKATITEKALGAGDITYDTNSSKVSFLQHGQESRESGLRTGADLANFEAVRFVRNLARKQHSEVLAQLARRMASAMRYSEGSGEDPFAKVKGLIAGMIEQLAKEAQAEASHKSYCDKEVGETLTKKSTKEAAISKLETKISAQQASSAQLKAQVAELQQGLAEIAATQSEMTALRRQEKELFAKNKPEMESGLEGVKMALSILRDYYAKEGKSHEAADGSGTGIIGLLEVVESDFTKSLAEMTAAEMTAEANYESMRKESEVSKATKEADVKYKTKEYKQLDAAIAEASSDKVGVQTELDAILEYNGHLIKMCEDKPETYEEKKSRREAEIAGLKEAMSILEGEASLLQRRAAARHLRGGQAHSSLGL